MQSKAEETEWVNTHVHKKEEQNTHKKNTHSARFQKICKVLSVHCFELADYGEGGNGGGGGCGGWRQPTTPGKRLCG